VETRRQGATLFGLVLALVVTLVVVQLWLVAAALDALHREDRGALVPAALASLALFAGNVVLLRYVTAFDRRLRETRPHE
jgi:uncharacterized protein DUF6755